MQFLLSGQFRGPECKRVMQQAIALRQRISPWLASLECDGISEVGFALRIGGTLGSFGPEGVENLFVKDERIECDIVIADKRWVDLADDEIKSLLEVKLIEAISICFEKIEIPFDSQSLREQLSD